MEKKKYKFNIVDALVVLIILAAAAFFLWKGMDKGEETEAKETIPVRFVVEVTGMEQRLYEEVEKNLPFTMAASGKTLDGTVLSCYSEPCTVLYAEGKSPVDTSRSMWVVPGEETACVNAFFVCEAQMDVSSNLNQVGSQEVRLGRGFYVKGVDVELYGTVISLEKNAG